MKFSIDVKVTEGRRRRPELEADIDGRASLADLLEYTKGSLILIADQVFHEEIARGFDKNPIVAVDGKVGAPIASVHPLGKIEFTSRASMKEILLETYQGILGRSPVLTGRYRRSHRVLHNGKEVAYDLRSLKEWLDGNPKLEDKDYILFVNVQPYARKLERLGVTYGNARYSSRSVRVTKSKNKKGEVRIRMNQPNGTYYLTARAIRTKYKRNSIIRFTFISGSLLGLTASFKTGRRGKNSAGRPYIYPAILISVQENGSV